MHIKHLALWLAVGIQSTYLQLNDQSTDGLTAHSLPRPHLRAEEAPGGVVTCPRSHSPVEPLIQSWVFHSHSPTVENTQAWYRIYWSHRGRAGDQKVSWCLSLAFSLVALLLRASPTHCPPSCPTETSQAVSLALIRALFVVGAEMGAKEASTSPRRQSLRTTSKQPMLPQEERKRDVMGEPGVWTQGWLTALPQVGPPSLFHRGESRWSISRGS